MNFEYIHIIVTIYTERMNKIKTRENRKSELELELVNFKSN